MGQIFQMWLFHYFTSILVNTDNISFRQGLAKFRNKLVNENSIYLAACLLQFEMY